MKARMDVERMEAGSSDPAELLRAELMAVEPSPAFAADVRMRVERQGGFRLHSALGLTLASVAALAIVATVASLWRGPVETVPAATVADATDVPPVVKPTAPEPTPKRKPSAVRARVPLGEDVPMPTANPGPYLEVITNQPELIRQVWTQALTAGFLDRPGLRVESVLDITAAPIVVEPIVVPLLRGPGGGDPPPAARRVTADDSWRGAQR